MAANEMTKRIIADATINHSKERECERKVININDDDGSDEKIK